MIRKRQLSSPEKSRSGMILIVITIVLVILSLAGFGFVAVMYTENKAAHLHIDEIHVQNAAASGTELLKGILATGPAGREAAGGLYDNPESFQGAVVYVEPGTNASVRMTLLSPRIENGQYAGVRYGAENESAKINLTVLPQWDKLSPEAGRKALMQLPEMTTSVADAILDWIDTDTAQRQAGAEEDYYSGLDPPYAPRNGKLESLDELLLVKGVTRQLLFGDDVDQNFQVEEQESSTGSGIAGLSTSGNSLPWAAYLTLYSAERNAGPDGRPRIDVNLSDLRELNQKLTGQLQDSWIRFIIAYRQYGPYTGSDEGKANATIRLDLNPPAKYKIASLLDLVGARVSVPSQSGPAEVYQSPISETLDSMRTSLPKLLDLLTVDKIPVYHGRININRAPREVLAAVPDMPESVIDQIVAGQELPDGESDSSRRHPTWPLTQGLLSLDTMKKILPYLTCGGDVYRAQVVGYFDHGTPSARAEVVIDATGGMPRQIYYKDLRMLGRGYSMETLRGEQLENLPNTSAADSFNSD